MPRCALHHRAPAEDFRGILCPFHSKEVCNDCWKKHIGMKIEDRGMIKCFCGRVLGDKEIRLRAGEELWERYLEVKEKREKDTQDAVLAAFRSDAVGDKNREGAEGKKEAEEDAANMTEKEVEEDAGFILVEREHVQADEEWTLVDIEEAEV